MGWWWWQCAWWYIPVIHLFVSKWYVDAILWSMLSKSLTNYIIHITNKFTTLISYWCFKVSICADSPNQNTGHFSKRFTWHWFSNWPFTTLVSQTSNILMSIPKFWEWPDKVHPPLFPNTTEHWNWMQFRGLNYWFIRIPLTFITFITLLGFIIFNFFRIIFLWCFMECSVFSKVSSRYCIIITSLNYSFFYLYLHNFFFVMFLVPLWFIT